VSFSTIFSQSTGATHHAEGKLPVTTRVAVWVGYIALLAFAGRPVGDGRLPARELRPAIASGGTLKHGGHRGSSHRGEGCIVCRPTKTMNVWRSREPHPICGKTGVGSGRMKTITRRTHRYGRGLDSGRCITHTSDSPCSDSVRMPVFMLYSVDEGAGALCREDAESAGAKNAAKD